VTGNLNSTNSRVACDQTSLQAGANVTSSIDFEEVRSQLLNTSRDLCVLPDTGIQANLSEGGALSLTLSANASELSVINLNATDLATLRFLRINASSSDNTTRRFVVINILGSTTTDLSANTTGIATGTTTTANATSSANATVGAEELLLRGFGMSLEGLNSSQLLWNFCNATNINVQFLRLMGSVLAPEARLRLSNAGHEGSIVARSLEASFTSQNPAPFEGFFCPSASASPSPSASPATSPSPSP
jgi:choice-of-anchor A domain-containing protein